MTERLFLRLFLGDQGSLTEEDAPELRVLISIVVRGRQYQRQRAKAASATATSTAGGYSCVAQTETIRADGTGSSTFETIVRAT